MGDVCQPVSWIIILICAVDLCCCEKQLKTQPDTPLQIPNTWLRFFFFFNECCPNALNCHYLTWVKNKPLNCTCTRSPVELQTFGAILLLNACVCLCKCFGMFLIICEQQQRSMIKFIIKYNK